MTGMQQPNAFTALRPDLKATAPERAEVNCGIIMASDGSFKLFSNGIDANALKAPFETLTEAQKGHLAMGQKLMALSLALANDQIMAILMDLVANTDVVDPEKLAHVVRRN